MYNWLPRLLPEHCLLSCLFFTVMDVFLTPAFRTRLQHLRNYGVAAVIVIAVLTFLAAIFSAVNFYSLHTPNTPQQPWRGTYHPCKLVSSSFGHYLPRENTILLNCTIDNVYNICYVQDVHQCFPVMYNSSAYIYREIIGLLFSLKNLHHPPILRNVSVSVWRLPSCNILFFSLICLRIMTLSSYPSFHFWPWRKSKASY